MLRITELAFPGLGIGKFEVNSVALTIFGVEIAWYAIFITLGMICAVAYCIFRARQVGISIDDVIDIALFTIPIGIVGARLYYVINAVIEGSQSFKTFYDWIDIRSGGLAIYGGIVAGAITVLCVCRFKKIDFLAFADCAMPGVILAQGIGRWGNFMNGEVFGEHTDLFCRMEIRNALTGGAVWSVHPTFFYESLWNVLGFVIANLFYRKRKFDGQVFIFLMAWYGLGRCIIEGIREDHMDLTIFGLSLRINQLIAGIFFVIFSVLFIALTAKKVHKPLYCKLPTKAAK